MEREHFRKFIKETDDDLAKINDAVQSARDRLAAADVKYRERMAPPPTPKKRAHL